MEESGASPSRSASERPRLLSVGQGSSVRSATGSAPWRILARPAATVVPMHPEMPAMASVSSFIHIPFRSRSASLLLLPAAVHPAPLARPSRRPLVHEEAAVHHDSAAPPRA